jgi:hypothetical protein
MAHLAKCLSIFAESECAGNPSVEMYDISKEVKRHEKSDVLVVVLTCPEGMTHCVVPKHGRNVPKMLVTVSMPNMTFYGADEYIFPDAHFYAAKEISTTGRRVTIHGIFPALEELNLHGCETLTVDRDLPMLKKLFLEKPISLPFVKGKLEVNFRSGNKVFIDGTRAVLVGRYNDFHHLFCRGYVVKNLVLSLDSETWKSISHFKDLEELHFNWISGPTDDFFEELAAMPKLQKISYLSDLELKVPASLEGKISE